MNSLYLKDDFEWDCNICSSIIRREGAGIEEAITDFSKLLADKKEQIANAATGELIAIDEIPDDLGERFSKAMNDLQNARVYNALFVMINSYLEFSLVEICRFAGMYLKVNFLTYSKDKGLTKVKSFLKDKLNIDVSRNKEWSGFKVQSDVRNLIVHNNANIIVDYEKKLEDQPKYNSIVANRNFEITETGFLFINTLEYIRENHEIATRFSTIILEEVKIALKKTLEK